MFVSKEKMTDAPLIGGSLPDVPRESSTKIVRSWLPRATCDGAALYVARLRLLFVGNCGSSLGFMKAAIMSDDCFWMAWYRASAIAASNIVGQNRAPGYAFC
jgi:hypothetical protein